MNEDSPLFSVIVPLYNKKTEVLRALNSILDQTHENFEVIVVNDGSTDGSESLIRSIPDKRLKLIEQSNQGQGAARNRGIRECRGEYVAFLDADDTWAPGHLERILCLIDAHPKAGAYATAFAYRKHGSAIVEPVSFKNLPTPPWQGVLHNYIKVLASETSPVHTNSICVRRSVLERVGGFNEALPLAQDIDLWIRIFLSNEIYYSTDITTYYHLGTDNQVTRQRERYNKYLKFVANLSNYVSDESINLESRHLLRSMQLGLGRHMLWRAIFNGDYLVANNTINSHLAQLTAFEKILILALMQTVPSKLMRMTNRTSSQLRLAFTRTYGFWRRIKSAQ